MEQTSRQPPESPCSSDADDTIHDRTELSKKTPRRGFGPNQYPRHLLMDEAAKSLAKSHAKSKPGGSTVLQTDSLLSTPLMSQCATSRMSRDSCRNTAVKVRLWSLPRQDTLPCPHTGRRTFGVANRLIRIFVRLPCRGRMALWVDPDLPVGPPPVPKPNRFTDVWGEDADEQGPFHRRDPTGGRLTPLRALLAKRLAEEDRPDAKTAETANALDVLQFSATSDGLTAAQHNIQIHGPANLKDLVEKATGVPVTQQKLVFGGVGSLDDHSRCLCDYGVGHGALLLLSLRPEGRSARGSETFLASPRLSKVHEPSQIMNNVANFKHKDKTSGYSQGNPVVESLPDWQRATLTPLQAEWKHEQGYFDYQFLPGNSFLDRTGRDRRRFPTHDRLAKSASGRLVPWPPSAPHTAR
mmetsp:Transcript_82565/g.159513  ORF Transcript_82565/g.159513 Transcript_82565/m.159513 type:complete len:411 (-) Transcript_82565:514-1746(-)